jgi:hypothetical protein
MKQLLSLFLFLLPCLAWAQYPSNGNQKITLGEQTTADGLIFRGVAATDTVRKPSVDTMAYMVLDTTTNIIWHYKKATSNAWLRLNLLPSDTASMLTNYWRSGRFSGTLPVANGGTGSATQNFVDLTTTQTVGGVKTFSSTANFTADDGIKINNTNGFIIGGNTTAGRFFFTNTDLSSYFVIYGSAYSATQSNDISYVTNTTNVFQFNNDGNFGVGIGAPTEKLHVVGNARITAVGSGAYSNDLNITSTGVLTTAASSDETFKYNINPITYGLSTILQLKPVSFQWKKGDEHDLGFIAQDAVNIIPEAVDTFWDSSLLFRSNTIIPILTKAIQEQQALIKALEQRIINLENK